MPARILYDTSCLRDGRRQAGIGRYAARLLDALRARDDVDVVSAGPERPPLSESRPYRWLHAQPALRSAARGLRPALLHAPGGEPAILAGGTPQVVTVHDVEMWRMPLPGGGRGAALRAHRRAVAALLRRCAAVIAVSPTSAGEATEVLGLDPGRVHVVAHGVSPAFSASRARDDGAVAAAAGADPGGYLLWTGSLRHHDPRKGLDGLLAALTHLGFPAPPLVLAGAGGPEAERVASRGRDLGLRVRLAGSLDEPALAALYRQALACVIPSRHEGFGLPLLEAMACGAPTVCTAVGNLPELAGDAAVVVPGGDAAVFAAALRRVLDSPDLRGRLRAAGPVRAAQFTWERCAAETAEVYRTVLASR